MTATSQQSLGNSRQRGFWLRCFLGKRLTLVFLLCFLSKNAIANECSYRPVYVRNLLGHVSYATGEDAHGAKITVKDGAKAVFQSTTNQKGDFQLKVPRGEYELTAEAPGFLPSAAHVHVGFSLRSLFRRDLIKLRLDVTRVC